MIKEKNKEELISEIDIGMKYKSDLTLIQNEFRVKKAEKTTLDQQKNELQDFLNKQVADTNIKKLQIESQMGELKERQTTIADKEQKIDELRKRTQELEKFKFVLDYKIKELKHKIGPRERKIQVLNEQKTKMQNEVKHFEVVNRNLQLIVQDLKDKLEGLQQEQKHIQDKINFQVEYMKQFKDDVYDTLNNHLGDYKKLKKGIVKLHKVYVKEEVNHNETNEADATHQHNNQRRYLEKNLEHNRWQLSKEQTVHKQEYSRIMKENVTLLQEINTLKSREHKIQLEIEGLEKIINNIKKRGRGIIPDDGLESLTEEQHRQLEASQTIEMLTDEVT